ncbi:hypothetical protein D3C78_1351780 [compost metagenome]
MTYVTKFVDFEKRYFKTRIMTGTVKGRSIQRPYLVNKLGLLNLLTARLSDHFFYAIRRADQCNVRATVGKQTHGNHTSDAVDLIFQRDSVKDFQVVHVQDHVAVIG